MTPRGRSRSVLQRTRQRHPRSVENPQTGHVRRFQSRTRFSTPTKTIRKPMPASRAVTARTCWNAALTRRPARGHPQKPGSAFARSREASKPCFGLPSGENGCATTGPGFQRVGCRCRFHASERRQEPKRHPTARSWQGFATQIEVRWQPHRCPGHPTPRQRIARAPRRRLAASLAFRRAKRSSRDRNRGARLSSVCVVLPPTLLPLIRRVDPVRAVVTRGPRPISPRRRSR